MRRYGRDERVLCSLRESAGNRGEAEILVAEGRSPSRQRNAALELAQGEIVVFLDNDCRPLPGYWEELEHALARPGVDVVGGPVLLLPGATWNEKIFHALLAHRLLAGPVSSRYTSRGDFRPATQSDLILCNLAMRRAAMEKVGPFSAHLYPNEENEWLERAARLQIGIFYDPLLTVDRPQRRSWGAFLTMLFRYGVGRTRQSWISHRFTLHQLAPLLLLVPIGVALLGEGAGQLFLGGWLIVATFISATSDGYLDISQRIVAGLAAPLVPFAYALGQLAGWTAFFLPRSGTADEITIRDENGNPVTRTSQR